MAEFIEALSIDQKLEKSLADKSIKCPVHSVFKRAINFTASSGELITILSKKDFNGPNTVLVSERYDLTLPGIEPGDPAVLNKQGIYIDKKVFISFSKALKWDYVPFSSEIKLDVVKMNFGKILKSLCHISSAFFLYSEKNDFSHMASVVEEVLSPYCSQKEIFLLSENFITLINGIKNNNKRRIENSISRIIGLGSGLTPVGDDFLIGFLSVFFYLRADFKNYDNILNNLISVIGSHKNKTNFISSGLISFALSGRFSQPVLEILDFLFFSHEEEDFSFDNLKDYGASSGIATLLGIIFGICLFTSIYS